MSLRLALLRSLADVGASGIDARAQEEKHADRRGNKRRRKGDDSARTHTCARDARRPTRPRGKAEGKASRKDKKEQGEDAALHVGTESSAWGSTDAHTRTRTLPHTSGHLTLPDAAIREAYEGGPKGEAEGIASVRETQEEHQDPASPKRKRMSRELASLIDSPSVHTHAHGHASEENDAPTRRRRVRVCADGDHDQSAALITKHMNALAHMILEGRRVVFVTGAGLSRASGIPVFRASRSNNDAHAHTHGHTSASTETLGSGVSATSSIDVTKAAIWSKHVQSMGTRGAFHRDPVEWYNSFWLKNFAPFRLRVSPNSGHEAIASLAAMDSTNVKVITQNIDALHQSTSVQWDHESLLIEAHGRVGLYKCSSDPDEDCPFANDQSLDPDRHTLPPQMLHQLGHTHPPNDQQGQPSVGSSSGSGSGSGSTARSHPGQVASKDMIPRCPSCGDLCMPQALLFDEDYTDHDFYQFDALEDWLGDAEVLVFIGTSFAVTLTTLAIDAARERRLPIFNFNTEECAHRFSSTLDWRQVYGRAEERLPELLGLVEEAAAAAVVGK